MAQNPRNRFPTVNSEGRMAAPRRRLDLRKTLFLLPNMITLSSIFCGFDSIRLGGSDDGVTVLVDPEGARRDG